MYLHQMGSYLWGPFGLSWASCCRACCRLVCTACFSRWSRYERCLQPGVALPPHSCTVGASWCAGRPGKPVSAPWEGEQVATGALSAVVLSQSNRARVKCADKTWPTKPVFPSFLRGPSRHPPAPPQQPAALTVGLSPPSSCCVDSSRAYAKSVLSAKRTASFEFQKCVLPMSRPF